MYLDVAVLVSMNNYHAAAKEYILINLAGTSAIKDIVVFSLVPVLS